MTFRDELDKYHEQWRTLNLSHVFADENAPSRNPGMYQYIVDKFNVGTSARYAPRDGLTFCNIFVSDVTRAMLAEIPHWVVEHTTPATHKDDGARELTANATIDLMPAWDWRSCTVAEAIQRANIGQPTVAAWRNLVGHGHIAMVMPSTDEIIVAQAGFSRGIMPLSVGFGSKRVKDVRYFWHP